MFFVFIMFQCFSLLFILHSTFRAAFCPPPWPTLCTMKYWVLTGTYGDTSVGLLWPRIIHPIHGVFFRTWQADLGSPGGLNVQFSWAQCHCWVEWGIFGKDWWEPPRKKTKIWSIFWEIIPSGQKRGQRQATNCRPSAGTVASTIAQRLPESCCPQTSWPHSAGRPIFRPHGVWGPRSFLPWIAEEAI